MTQAASIGDVEAIAQIEQDHFEGVRAGLLRLDLSPSDRDEVVQLTRLRLFTASTGGVPKIAYYSGHGKLSRWLQVVAVRIALEQMRQHRPHQRLEDVFAQLPVAQIDLELAYFKANYRSEFHNAVAQVVRALDDDHRRYLRLHIVDHASLEQVAKIEGIHRATAARRIARAKECFLTAIRARLFSLWGGESQEGAGILRLIQSDFGANLSSLLRRVDIA